MQDSQIARTSEIFERFELGLSVAELQSYLTSVITMRAPVMQSDSFGGWSVTSTDGDYRTGWEKGHLTIRESKSGPVVDESCRLESALPKTSDAKIPTELHFGYVQKVLERIQSHGILIRRVRISLLKSTSSSIWHRDALPNQYAARLHIPIITNNGCLFCTESTEEHAPADGAGYFVSVNQLHKIKNCGDTDRYHLMMDAIDAKNVTMHHSIQNFKQKQSPSHG